MAALSAEIAIRCELAHVLPSADCPELSSSEELVLPSTDSLAPWRWDFPAVQTPSPQDLVQSATPWPSLDLPAHF
eukprot:309425-Amphidinium_carterae.1